MDNESIFQELYKSNCGVIKNVQNRVTESKRKRQEKRNDRFQAGRIISPTPKKKIITEKKYNPAAREQSKQEAFCQKFLAWKQEKYEKKKEEPKSRKKPFISTCTGGVGVGSVPKKETSFAPKKHVFVPPQSLKLMDEKKKMALLVVNKVKNNKTDQLTQNCLLPPKKSPIFVKKKQTTIPLKAVTNQSNSKSLALKEKNLKENSKPHKCSFPKDGKFVRQISNFVHYSNPQQTNSHPAAPKLKLLKDNLKIPPFTFPKHSKFVKPILNCPSQKENRLNAKKSQIQIQKRALSEPGKFVKPNLTSHSHVKITSTETNNELLKPNCYQADFTINTPKENGQNPFKTFYTSTQRKGLSCLDDVMTNNESMISPIESSSHNITINLKPKPKQNYFMFPSPQINRISDLKPIKKNENETINSNHIQSSNNYNNIKISAIRENIFEKLPKENLQKAASEFRKNLDVEVERLNKVCKSWELYMHEADRKVLDASGGANLINATIGQTKLLTCNKFKQFRDLIDRFEISASKDNKNEKPIGLEELKSFWSIVSIQIDDVEKSIENLNRWKDNHWCNPDEKLVQRKSNRLLSKVTKKPKATKKNRGIQDYLKKLHAEIIKNKRKNLNNFEGTPKKFISEQRKSISMKQTTPVRRSSRCLILSANKNSKKTPRISNIDHVRNITPHKQSEWQCENLLKFNEKLIENDEILKTPIMLPRKSILKTPGTLKRNQNVVFNENLFLKSPEEILHNLNQ